MYAVRKAARVVSMSVSVVMPAAALPLARLHSNAAIIKFFSMTVIIKKEAIALPPCRVAACYPAEASVEASENTAVTFVKLGNTSFSSLVRAATSCAAVTVAGSAV